MKRSTDSILTTHVGSLVRPPDLVEIMRAKESGQPYDQQKLAATVRSSVAEVVQKQAEVGVNIPSDGEYGKAQLFWLREPAAHRVRAQRAQS
jgi:5-methyltetrahydropteroyltriglutamate--homocysteine methyltransferase